MAKAKAKGRFLAADGAGGMVTVEDFRFETSNWPIRFEVPIEQADTWFRHFYAECERRGWSSSGIGQIEAKENSGSVTVNAGGLEKSELVVVWEWKRSSPIKVRARSAGRSEFPLVEGREFFEKVNERCRSGATERFYRRGHLEYSGLPWRGEVWLEDDTPCSCIDFWGQSTRYYFQFPRGKITLPEVTMFNRQALAGPAGYLLLMGVERRFEALLAEHDAANPSELPRTLQSELLRRAIVETAAANAPTADPNMLDHATRSLTHPLFVPAWSRVKSLMAVAGDAFAMASGLDAAVVLAGFGLSVAPFDFSLGILEKPSDHIDTVLAMFFRWPVGSSGTIVATRRSTCC